MRASWKNQESSNVSCVDVRPDGLFGSRAATTSLQYSAVTVVRGEAGTCATTAFPLACATGTSPDS
ncbi:MAG: hypothetical protein ACLR3C_07180 [Eggerthella lenta]